MKPYIEFLSRGISCLLKLKPESAISYAPFFSGAPHSVARCLFSGAAQAN